MSVAFLFLNWKIQGSKLGIQTDEFLGFLQPFAADVETLPQTVI